MIRSIEDLGLLEFSRNELRGVLRLSPTLLGSLLLVTLLWSSGMASSGALFQSPGESPLETPTVPATEAPTLTATSAPTSPPAATATGEPTVPVPTATVPPVPSPTLATTPAATVTAAPTAEPSPTVTAMLPTASLTASPTDEMVEATTTPDSSERYPEEDAGLSFDWGMLFDSLALGASYVWLCCGILLLFGVPVAFAALWLASRRRAGEEE